MLRTFVSFECDIDNETNADAPRGKALADIVVAGLIQDGLEVSPPEEREEWAWNIFLHDRQFQIESIVGHVGDGEIQWLITNHLHLSFLTRITSRDHAGSRGDDTLRRYCQSIDNTIKRDGRIRTIRWYSQEDFDREVYDRWTETPGSNG